MTPVGTPSIKDTGDVAGLSPQVLVKELEDGPPQLDLTLALATLTLLAQLGEAFCQKRTALRAWRMAVGQALALGGRTIPTAYHATARPWLTETDSRCNPADRRHRMSSDRAG